MGPALTGSLGPLQNEKASRHRLEVPEEFAAAVEEYQLARGRASAEVIGRTWQDGRPRAVPGSVFVVAQEFRAAYAEGVAG
ncbi:predicted protein [Streptomyces sp. C]|nr:predicted protein [Streptomyces sp. C]